MRKHTQNQTRTRLPFLMTSVLATLAAGCELPAQVVTGDDTTVDILPPSSNASPSPTPTVDAGHAVCNPLDNTAGTGQTNYGLNAKFSYIPNGHTGMYHGVADFLHQSEPIDVQLFFNALNVPTRPFDAGFTTQDGVTLKTPNGDTLYEFFGLQFQSVIRLTNNETPGLYQFAIISDDGAVMRIQPPGAQQFETWVNNDGDHAAQLGCAQEAVALDYDSRLPMQLDYYQGPRYHIALMLMWRKVSDNTPAALAESTCGKNGISLYFDSNYTPSKPQQTYLDLLAKGWKVLQPGNYMLPSDSAPNPCTTPSPTPSPSPSPSTSPTCSGPFCGGGIIGS